MSVPVERAEVVRQLAERGYREAARSPKHVLYVVPGADARPVVLPLGEWIAPGVYRLVTATAAEPHPVPRTEIDDAFARLDALFARNHHVTDPAAAVRAERDSR